MDWKKLFRQQILERGFFYYLDNHVQNLQIRGKRFVKAKVTGTEVYHVNIDLKHLELMTCTCPHFAGGNNCKHLAATLCAVHQVEAQDLNMYRHFDEFETEEEIEELEHQIEQLLDECPAHLLRSFMKDILMGDQRYYEMLIDHTLEVTYSDFSVQLLQLQYLLSKPEGMSKVPDYLERYVRFEDLHHAFIFIRCICDHFLLHGLANKAEALIELLIPYLARFLETDISKEVYDWFSGVLLYSGTIPQPFIQLLLVENENHPSLQALRDKMDHTLMNQESIDKRTIHHLNQRIKLGKILPEFVEKYQYIPQACELFVAHFIQEGNYEKALALIEGNPNETEAYGMSTQKMHIYELTNNHQGLKQILFDRLTTIEFDDCVAYRRLKELCNEEEWPSIREKIYEATTNQGESLLDYYLVEGDLHLMMEEIERTDDFDALCFYEDELICLYPEKILAIYVRNVYDLMRLRGKRELYREVGELLIHIEKLPGGKEIVGDILNEFHKEYAKRPALWLEFEQLGIDLK